MLEDLAVASLTLRRRRMGINSAAIPHTSDIAPSRPPGDSRGMKRSRPPNDNSHYGCPPTHGTSIARPTGRAGSAASRRPTHDEAIEAADAGVGKLIGAQGREVA
jgi:hypothetical protein